MEVKRKKYNLEVKFEGKKGSKRKETKIDTLNDKI